jgi:SAM-dependent methyltransferase
MKQVACPLCGNSAGNNQFTTFEMMLGSRDEFTYNQCASCQCLSLINVPNNIGEYYPNNYYSLNQVSEDLYRGLKGGLFKFRNRFAVEGKGLFGRLLYYILPENNLRSLINIEKTNQSSFLDIGCGSGKLLYCLKGLGYKNLTGIDPYINENIIYSNGVTIEKKSISELEGHWDVVMLHHVFEHLDHPRKVLEKIVTLLKPSGKLLIRIPIVPNYAWEKYGINWVQLDAPRHLYIHSLTSINKLTEGLPLLLERVEYDSMPFQLLGSEQYSKGIPLWANNSYKVNWFKSIFTMSDIVKYYFLNKKLNSTRRSDQVCLYFRLTDYI